MTEKQSALMWAWNGTEWVKVQVTYPGYLIIVKG